MSSIFSGTPCRSIGENLKKSYFIFFKLSPSADLDFENL